MARTSLQDMRSLADPLQQYNWDVVFPRIPGASDTRQMTFKAQSTSMPGSSLEQVAVAMHGVELRYAGRENFTHSWQITFLETRDVSTRDFLRNWQKTARDWITNTGSYKDIYSTSVQLILYDDIPQAVKTITLYGVFPETVDDSGLDGGQSGVVTTSVTFSFDYFDEQAGET